MKKNKKQIRKKPRYQYGNVDQESEQQANALVNGVGAINPIIGAALKVGQGVGKMTQDENGLYKSKAGEFFDNSLNPTTGITNLKDLSKDFSASTVANQLSLGLFGKSATQKRRERELKTQQMKEQLQWRKTHTPATPTLPTFENGGQLDNLKSSVMQGGQLTQISPDAVQVSANQPGKTDSVELENAFVDHGEIIDRENRVFSDKLKLPTGKTIAQEAKKLEKMKAADARFATANEFIDKRLDKLFATQTAMNTEREQRKQRKPALANGGPFSMDDLYNVKGPSIDRENAAFNSTKIGDLDLSISPKVGKGVDISSAIGSPATTTATTGKKIDWKKAGNAAATFGPDLANLFITSKMKGPKGPQKESSVFLKRINADDQLAENRRQTANLINATKRSVAQPGAAMAIAGSALAKRLYADNQTRGEVNRMNTQIANQEAGLNSAVGARNADRQNAANLLETEFHNRKLSAYSQIAANMGNKFTQKQRENRLFEADEKALRILGDRYKDSGIQDRYFNDRLKELYPEFYKKEEKEKKKMGGKLKKKC